MGCVEECEGEYIAITRDRVEEWTQLVREQAALTQFQNLALQAGSNLTTFADLPDLYSQMGEALTLDREEQAICSSSAAGHLPVKPPCPYKWPVSRPGGGSVCAISHWKPTRTP